MPSRTPASTPTWSAYWSILAHRVETPGLAKLGAKNVNELSDADWESLRHELGNQRLLGMSLDAGGHLTHGFRPNISGKMFHQQQYGTDPETGLLDYDHVAAQAREFKPLVLVAGYSAYPRRVNFAKMREIADEVGATLMVDMAHFAGLVAGKVFTGDEDPVPHAHVTTTTTHKSLRGPRGGMVLAQEEFAGDVDRGCPMVLGGPLSHMMAAKAVALAEARTDEFRTYAQNIADNAKSLAEGFLKRDARLVTGGTDNHIVLLDVTSFGLTGRQAETALLDAGVVTNRNSDPVRPERRVVHLRHPARHARAHDPRLRADEFDTVAELIVHVLQNTQPGTTKAGGPSKASYSLAEGVADKVKGASAEMLDKYPLYPGLELSWSPSEAIHRRGPRTNRYTSGFLLRASAIRRMTFSCSRALPVPGRGGSSARVDPTRVCPSKTTKSSSGSMVAIVSSRLSIATRSPSPSPSASTP